ncbi:hypothetical protein HQ529_03655 [Candidatus Woesearchaeota archaeon]|nr:hypothetical protein [Candidatus Woesearchaeota archaeon]
MKLYAEAKKIVAKKLIAQKKYDPYTKIITYVILSPSGNQYLIELGVGGSHSCDCKHKEHFPDNLCKHEIAAMLMQAGVWAE